MVAFTLVSAFTSPPWDFAKKYMGPTLLSYPPTRPTLFNPDQSPPSTPKRPSPVTAKALRRGRGKSGNRSLLERAFRNAVRTKVSPAGTLPSVHKVLRLPTSPTKPLAVYKEWHQLPRRSPPSVRKEWPEAPRRCARSYRPLFSSPLKETSRPSTSERVVFGTINAARVKPVGAPIVNVKPKSRSSSPPPDPTDRSNPNSLLSLALVHERASKLNNAQTCAEKWPAKQASLLDLALAHEQALGIGNAAPCAQMRSSTSLTSTQGNNGAPPMFL